MCNCIVLYYTGSAVHVIFIDDKVVLVKIKVVYHDHTESEKLTIFFLNN